MEVTHKFSDQGLFPTVFTSHHVSAESRPEEQRNLIASASDGSAQMEVDWFFKITPMNHGLRDAAVQVGICQLSYEGGLNMPRAEFDLSQFTVKTKFTQRSKDQFNVMVIEDVHIHLDQKEIEFIFSI